MKKDLKSQQNLKNNKRVFSQSDDKIESNKLQQTQQQILSQIQVQEHKFIQRDSLQYYNFSMGEHFSPIFWNNQFDRSNYSDSEQNSINFPLSKQERYQLHQQKQIFQEKEQFQVQYKFQNQQQAQQQQLNIQYEKKQISKEDFLKNKKKIIQKIQNLSYLNQIKSINHSYSINLKTGHFKMEKENPNQNKGYKNNKNFFRDIMRSICKQLKQKASVDYDQFQSSIKMKTQQKNIKYFSLTQYGCSYYIFNQTFKSQSLQFCNQFLQINQSSELKETVKKFNYVGQDEGLQKHYLSKLQKYVKCIKSIIKNKQSSKITERRKE